MEKKGTQKSLQREAALRARNALDAQTAERFSKIISEKIIVHPVFEKAETILSYQALKGEVDPSLLNEFAVRSGKRVAFPLCYKQGIMVAAVPHSEDDWETGRFGLKTPVEARSAILDPSDIDLVIVPCVAFDGRSKMRIGWGAGYYDRYLPQCKNATTIAIAFEAQSIDGLCHDDWDIPLDAVITEEKRY
jgi:5-formyltetrahydrofolate cyclo-ligase